MTKKPTVFVVFDIETTVKHRIAFDVAWKTIDRRGRVYGRGSYIIREAFQCDTPYFKEKMGLYFDDAFERRVTPASVVEVRNEFNRQVAELQDAGHRVILAAYNAAFDSKYLPHTFNVIMGTQGIGWMQRPVELLDIWDFWGQSVPLHYSATPSASGKYYSTSAESAYRFEFMQDDFEEYHRAWHDVEIEAEILLKALARKKAMPVVKSPAQFAGAVWQKINTRLGVDGKAALAA